MTAADPAPQPLAAGGAPRQHRCRRCRAAPLAARPSARPPLLLPLLLLLLVATAARADDVGIPSTDQGGPGTAYVSQDGDYCGGLAPADANCVSFHTALLNPSVTRIVLTTDVTLSPDEFSTVSPYVLSRNLTVTSILGSSGRPYTLDFNFLPGVVQLAPNTLVNITRIRVENARKAVGVTIDFFKGAPGAAIVMNDVSYHKHLALPVEESANLITTYSRLKRFPGKNQTVQVLNPAGCKGESVPDMMYVDVAATLSAATDAGPPGASAAGPGGGGAAGSYDVWFRNVTRECDEIIPNSCLVSYTPDWCSIMLTDEHIRRTQGDPHAASVTPGAAAGIVLGVVGGAFVAVGAALLALRWRRRRLYEKRRAARRAARQAARESREARRASLDSAAGGGGAPDSGGGSGPGSGGIPALKGPASGDSAIEVSPAAAATAGAGVGGAVAGVMPALRPPGGPNGAGPGHVGAVSGLDVLAGPGPMPLLRGGIGGAGGGGGDVMGDARGPPAPWYSGVSSSAPPTSGGGSSLAGGGGGADVTGGGGDVMGDGAGGPAGPYTSSSLAGGGGGDITGGSGDATGGASPPRSGDVSSSVGAGGGGGLSSAGGGFVGVGSGGLGAPASGAALSSAAVASSAPGSLSTGGSAAATPRTPTGGGAGAGAGAGAGGAGSGTEAAPAAAAAAAPAPAAAFGGPAAEQQV